MAEFIGERLNNVPITKYFTTHHPGSEHCLVWLDGEPWLCWKNPEGQWVREASVVFKKCLECGVPDGGHADGCWVLSPDDGTPSEVEQKPPGEEIINICEHGVVISDGTSCPQCDNGTPNGL